MGSVPAQGVRSANSCQESVKLFASKTMETSLASAGIFALMGLGLVFGLKHATEIDHVVAVSTVVSEHRNIWR